jgi:hypothetical protein
MADEIGTFQANTQLKTLAAVLGNPTSPFAQTLAALQAA